MQLKELFYQQRIIILYGKHSVIRGYPLFFKKSSHLIKGERIKNVISLFMNMLSFIINFTISAVYLYVISTSFSTFFNISNNVVWIVHIFSFFIALILSLISLHKIEPEVFYLFKKKNRLKL